LGGGSIVVVVVVVLVVGVLDVDVVLLVVVLEVEVVLVEMVDEVDAVVVVTSRSSWSTVPGNSVGSTKEPVSTPSDAAVMKLRQMAAGRVPPVTPRRPRLWLTEEPSSISGTVPSGSGCA
jgi:hypothetical protein